MNLKVAGFSKQHLFQISRPLEDVGLAGEERVGAGLCRLRELVQGSRNFGKVLSRLLHIVPQLLEKTKGSACSSSSFPCCSINTMKRAMKSFSFLEMMSFAEMVDIWHLRTKTAQISQVEVSSQPTNSGADPLALHSPPPFFLKKDLFMFLIEIQI